MRASTLSVFESMRADLSRVDDRVVAAAELNYPIADQIVSDIVQSGGKRLRPLVLLLAGRAYHYDLDALVTAAAGVELLHTASLIHDDTVDRAGLRRGRPTLNTVLGTGPVILVGDFLFAQSAVLAAATGSPRVVSIFASTLADICDGQLLEIFDGHRLDQTNDDYIRRISGKTAALFAGSAEMGAVIAEAPEPHIQALRGYGLDLGLAFQIVDDVLDFQQDSRALGKPVGNDLRQGTVTLPALLYARRISPASAEAETLLAAAEGHLTDERAMIGIIEAIRATGALDEAVALARGYVERAKSRIDIVPNPETRAFLTELADFALIRTS